jgi:uncharacterized membrane protein YjgN (DUF898 family)
MKFCPSCGSPQPETQEGSTAPLPVQEVQQPQPPASGPPPGPVRITDATGVRIDFRGTGAPLFGIYIWTGIVTLITLFLFLPWATCVVDRWYYRNLYIGERRLHFDGNGLEFFPLFFGSLIISLLTVFIMAPWAYRWVLNWVYSHIWFEDELNLDPSQRTRLEFHGNPAKLLWLRIWTLLLTIITIGFWLAWRRVRLIKFELQNTTIGGNGLVFEGRGGEFFGITLAVGFLSVITLTIYRAWGDCWKYRWIWSNTRFVPGAMLKTEGETVVGARPLQPAPASPAPALQPRPAMGTAVVPRGAAAAGARTSLKPGAPSGPKIPGKGVPGSGPARPPAPQAPLQAPASHRPAPAPRQPMERPVAPRYPQAQPGAGAKRSHPTPLAPPGVPGIQKVPVAGRPVPAARLQPPPQPVQKRRVYACLNCGTKIEEGWAKCPVCSVTVGSKKKGAAAGTGVAKSAGPLMPMFLAIEEGDGAGGTYQLVAGQTIIGRSSSSDIVARDEMVSSNHARIVIADGNVVLEDLGSTNGCVVNGTQVQACSLNHGDRIEIGETVYRFLTG